MIIKSCQFDLQTQGNTDVVNITDQVAQAVEQTSLSDGIATVWVVGATAGITTTEFEPGLANHDLKKAFEGIAPENARYVHEETWHDDNGHSHVRASLLGPSLTIPIIKGRLQLGTWQQVVLIDFDTRPRDRRVIVQIIGQ